MCNSLSEEKNHSLNMLGLEDRYKCKGGKAWEKVPNMGSRYSHSEGMENRELMGLMQEKMK